MISHEVQYHIGRMPMHQGFTIDTLIAKDPKELGILLSPPPQEATCSHVGKTRPALSLHEYARKRIWRTVKFMKCVDHAPIPGQHTHVLLRKFAPEKARCEGCHFEQGGSMGCIYRDQGLMKYYIRMKYPIEPDEPDNAISIELPIPGQRPLIWELPLRVSQRP